MASNEKAARKRIFLLAGAVGIAVIAFFVLRSRGVDLRRIGEWLASVGDRWWAPVVFIAFLRNRRSAPHLGDISS